MLARPNRHSRALVCLIGALALLLAGCTNGGPSGPTERPGLDDVAAKLATALGAGDLSAVPLAGDRSAAETDLGQIFAGMDGLKPTVEVGTLTQDGDSATVELQQRYAFDLGEWTFNTTAPLRWIDSGWYVAWTPTIVHPDLTARTRLVHNRQAAHRGQIVGANNTPIVWDRPVYRVGIDKARVDAETALSSATGLAHVLGIDIASYVERVRAAGAQAFVVALTVREGKVPVEVDEIPGARAIEGSLPLADSPTFTGGLLGSVGQATAEDVERSGGQVAASDLVGQTGLQRNFDEQLRGKPGHTIDLVARTDSMLASTSPSPSASETPSAGPSATPSAPERRNLFTLAPLDGEPLVLTLDVDLQTKAEAVLSDQPGVAALVVLDAASGAVLAAGNSPAAGLNSYAVSGQWAPGSTFKIAGSLALLRRGMTPDSRVSCPAEIVVSNTRFTNHSGYPAAFTGQITLRQAVANSCNTAFIGQATAFGPDEQSAAAASLGVGVDYATGFNAFYGSVPPSDDPLIRGANSIGQGRILASPLAMAGEAASVAAGHTVVPWLVAGSAPTPTGTPLSGPEASALQDLMGAVITSGTASDLRGVLKGAKTGTAEFGVDGNTHRWTIGYTDRYAIAAFVETADSSANPLIKAFLS